MKEAPRQAEPDFLGRLVDKALGRFDTVVPRLPSVFEPLQPLVVPLYPEWGMSAQSHEEVEAGSSRTVTVGGEPEPLRFDPLRDAAKRGTAQAEGEAGRRISAALAPSPHPITSVGETQAFAQPIRGALSESRNEIAPGVERRGEDFSAARCPALLDFVDRGTLTARVKGASSPFATSVKTDQVPESARKHKKTIPSPYAGVEADARGQRKSARPGTVAPDAGSLRAVTVGGEPDALRFDPLSDDAQNDAMRAEAEAGRHISAVLVASPHPLTSAGEAETSAQPGSQVNRNEIAPGVERRGEDFSAARRPALPDFVDQGALAAPACKDKGMVTDASRDRPEDPVIAGAMVPKAQSILKALPTSMRRSADRQPPSSIQEVETEPVINVTIGRIEVRAVAEDSKASRRSHESRERKPMSLDEYLKQRGGGR